MGKKISIFLFFMFLNISFTYAHHPSVITSEAQSGPIITIPATTLEKGSFSFSFGLEFIDLEPFNDRDFRFHALRGEHIHSSEYVYHPTLSFSYGVTDDLTLSLKTFYVYIDNIKEIHPDEPAEIHSLGDSQGIGDTTFFGQYRFYKNSIQKLESSLLFGIKVPTGRTDAFSSHGERFSAEFQPGSGSWDPMLGLSLTKELTDKATFHSNLLYVFTRKGTQSTNLGDKFFYNFAVAYSPFNKISTSLELNGEWKEKMTVSNIRDKNSGGNTVYITPGLRYNFSDNNTAYFSFSVPVIEDLNGIQNKTDFKTLIGISMGF
ncbi:MAG: transporter [Proteobacteria bacterium]|nr:transporter [Pseudomonadota bacterium]